MLQPLRPGGGKYVGSAQKGDRVRVQKKKKTNSFFCAFFGRDFGAKEPFYMGLTRGFVCDCSVLYIC